MNLKSKPQSLIISIPSYKRPAEAVQRVIEIREQIDALEPSEKSLVHLKIFENSSTVAYRQLLAPFLRPGIEHISSPSNNGIYWNLLRCIEESQGDWVWILGDDDKIKEGIIKELIREIQANKCGAIIFKNFEVPEYSRLQISAIYDLFRVLSLSEVLFISSAIWRRDALVDHIGTFIETSFTMSPHLCVLLKILESNYASFCFLGTKNVEFEDSGRISWSTLEYMIKCSAVPQCLTLRSNQSIVAKAQLTNFLWAAQDAFAKCDDEASLKDWQRAFRYSLLAFSEFTSIKSIMSTIRKKTFSYLWTRFFLFKKINPSWEAAACLPSSLL